MSATIENESGRAAAALNDPVSEYFTSYEDFDIHRIMLNDKPRTQAYKDSILQNKQYIEGKIVMDVGCGTGILSIFCAQVGAKKVYAVEASNIAKIAKLVIKENNYENIIEVIESRVEDVTLDVKCDVIVSEWMGFYLLHECMLDSVITARDMFLKEDGLMFPEIATLYAAPCQVPMYYKYWEDVYGVKMTCIGQVERSKIDKPLVLDVNHEEIIGDSSDIVSLNLNVISKDELNTISKKVVSACLRTGAVQGVCLWFTCTFPCFDEHPVVLSTHPQREATHWKQTVIVLPKEKIVEQQEAVAFELTLRRQTPQARKYNIELAMLDPEEEQHSIPCNCYRTKCIVIKAFINQQEENESIVEVDNGGQSIAEVGNDSKSIVNGNVS